MNHPNFFELEEKRFQDYKVSPIGSPEGFPVLRHFFDDCTNLLIHDEVQQYLHGIKSFDYTITVEAMAATGVDYILVLEKNCIFREFVNANYHVNNNCILVSLSGHPCMAMKAYLYFLADSFACPVYGLADEGPHGCTLLHGCYHSNSETRLENEFSVKIGIIDHNFANNQAFNVTGAHAGAAFNQSDMWMANGSLRSPRNDDDKNFQSAAHDPSSTKRQELIERYRTTQTKYQLEHAPLHDLISATEVKCMMGDVL